MTAPGGTICSYEWPSPDENFVLNEGQRYTWFSLGQVLDLSDIADYAREELHLFRERIGLSH